MHEVERVLIEGLGDDIVPAHLEIRSIDLFQEARVEVGCYDMAVRPDVLAQPPGHRAAAASNLEAPPSLRHAYRLEDSDRAGVQDGFKRAEPLPFLLGGRIVDV